MSTIRPLATVAILAALGVFLAMKIQQQPVATTAELTGGWEDAPSFGSDDATSSSTSPGGDAPAFGDAPSFTDAASDPAAGPAFPSTTPTAPAVPAIEPPAATAPTPPALPPLPTVPMTDPTTAGQPAVPPATAASPVAVDPSTLSLPDLPLPENIPAAQYPGESAPAEGTISGRVPSLGTSTSDFANPTTPASEPWSPPATSPAPPASPDTASLPPAPPSFGGTPTADTYGVTPEVSPTTPSYATVRHAIQAALDRDELTRAHRLLSSWYGDPSLTPTEKQEVNRLLGQLAGTVIYSGEHRLEPAHQVQPGETMESIAKQYGTPWQLLAKINGVTTSDGVKPGQILKVVRGPFGATVDLSDGEVFLTVDGRYAGRFPAQVNAATLNEGTWKVADKAVKYDPTSPVADPRGYAKSIELEGPTGQTADIVATSTPGEVSVAARDLGDLFDILSEGSEVTVRR